MALTLGPGAVADLIGSVLPFVELALALLLLAGFLAWLPSSRWSLDAVLETSVAKENQ